MVPRIFGRSYAIEADLHVPDSGAEGVIVANADFIGGFALWVDAQGLLTHTHLFLPRRRDLQADRHQTTPHV
jgi:arylsulfatase